MGPPCVDCGADHEHIVEGYCGQCGRKQPGERDHLSEDLGVLAAATDRGKRHHRNEDAFGIGIVGDSFVTVVCDGVSTTDDPQEASLAAAKAARDFLVAALEEGASDLEAALVEATEKAQAAAAAVPRIVGGVGPASTTFVASIVATGADVVRSWTAWLGDSRAYWVHENGVDQLTTDDSWALDQVASGAMTEADANGDRRAQSITRWLGADAVKAAPSIHVAEHDPGGSLLLCSDGLWKYVPEPAELLALLQSQKAGTTLELAEALVAFANESGGHDNTTVVIVRTDVGNDVKTAM
jgi:serine/threonine protein phosphatase PrpC